MQTSFIILLHSKFKVSVLRIDWQKGECTYGTYLLKRGNECWGNGKVTGIRLYHSFSSLIRILNFMLSHLR